MILEVAEWSRFEIHVDGTLAGRLDYRLDGKTITLVHTEVDDAFAGRGLAGQLVREVLDRARTRGWTVRPECSYAAAWIERHPEYADLTTS